MNSGRYEVAPLRARDIFWALRGIRARKFGADLLTTLAAMLLLVVLVGLPALASPWLMILTIPLWFTALFFIFLYRYRFSAWMTEATLIFITTAAVTENNIPVNAIAQAQYSLSRMMTEKRYTLYRNTFTHALREIHLAKVRYESMVGDMLGVKWVTKALRTFQRIFLWFMRDACLAYVFFRGVDEGEEPTVGVTAACAYYCMNWKNLSKYCMDISLMIAAVFLVPAALLSVGLYFLLHFLGAGWFSVMGIPLAFLISYTLTDVYALTACTIYHVKQYLECAITAEPAEDVYHSMCRVSPTVRRLMERGGNMMPQPKPPVQVRRRQKRTPLRPADADHPLVCPRCKTANRTDAAYCAGCGFRLRGRGADSRRG